MSNLANSITAAHIGVAVAPQEPTLTLLSQVYELAHLVDVLDGAISRTRTVTDRIGISFYGAAPSSGSFADVNEKEISGGKTYLEALKDSLRALQLRADWLLGTVSALENQLPLTPPSTAVGRN